MDQPQSDRGGDGNGRERLFFHPGASAVASGSAGVDADADPSRFHPGAVACGALSIYADANGKFLHGGEVPWREMSKKESSMRGNTHCSIGCGSRITAVTGHGALQ
jgi:hypothetical protein